MHTDTPAITSDTIQEPLSCSDLKTFAISVFTLSTTFWTVGWFLSANRFINIGLQRTASPIDSLLFPGILASKDAAIGAYLLPALTLPFLFRLTPKRAIYISSIQLCCALIISFHIAYFSSARPHVLFWLASWNLLFASHLAHPKHESLREVVFYAKLVVIIIFFPAGIGKITEGYWNGDIFYLKFFDDPKLPTYKIITSILNSTQSKLLAIYSSRLAVITETACIIGLVLPFRYFLPYSCILLIGILIGSGVHPTVIAIVIAFGGTLTASYLLNLRLRKSTSKAALQPSPLFIILTGLAAAIVVTSAIMTISPSLQRVWMKQHQVSQQNRLVWAATHLISKMFTMENNITSVRAATNEYPTSNLSKRILNCFGRHDELLEHYHAYRLFRPRCRERLLVLNTAVIVELRSSYRRTCLESRILLEPTFASGEGRILVKLLEHRDCSVESEMDLPLK